MNLIPQPIRYANYSGSDLDAEKRHVKGCVSQAEELVFATTPEAFAEKLDLLVANAEDLVLKMKNYSSLNAKYITSRLDESLECLHRAQESLDKEPSDLDSAKSAIISFRDVSAETIKAFPRS